MKVLLQKLSGTGWSMGGSLGWRISRMIVGLTACALIIVAGTVTETTISGMEDQVPAQGHSAGVMPQPARTFAKASGLTILNPIDGALYPRDMAPPRFLWRDESEEGHGWVIELAFEDRQENLVYHSSFPEWTASPEDWDGIRRRSIGKRVRLTLRRQSERGASIESEVQSICFRISSDAVEAQILYREIALPMVESARTPSQVRWRSGTVDSVSAPRVVMENMPVCANCHSFSRDAAVMGLDVDHHSKGTFALMRTAPNMRLTDADMITWDDFEPGTKSNGLLAQVSPDGRSAISTVRDVSVFIQRRELAFSQLFFPVQGILAFYDREKRTFQEFPGADDPRFVQTNPVWSPDGRDVVFARSQAYEFPPDLPLQQRALHLERNYGRGLKPFKYDLYRIPFNEGRGGHPEPVRGASDNGRSNFFPKYSPDGKWIVFCQASNYMMLQPDSELYIIPVDGGEARKLNANTARMNSWHSWSPNSKWLVFSSKAHSDTTQLYLTHVDDHGDTSPPVLLERFHEPGYAANIPEFLPMPSFALNRIEACFAPELGLIAVGHDRFKHGDSFGAMDEYRKAVTVAPDNVEARQSLGLLLYYVQADREEALAHMTEAVRLAPKNPYMHHDLGMMRLHQGHVSLAISHLVSAVNLWREPVGPASEYNPHSAQYKQGLMLSPRHRRNRLLNPQPEMEFHLGLAFFLNRDFNSSARYLREATLNFGAPTHDATFRCLLAMALAGQGEVEEARKHYRVAAQVRPSVADKLQLTDLLGPRCAMTDQFRALIRMAQEKLEVQGCQSSHESSATVKEDIGETRP
jgi:Flp pilus assembly protein TadD